MAAKAEALQTDDVEGGVEPSWLVREFLPGVCVGDAVTFRGDDQLWVGRLWVQVHLTGIWTQVKKIQHEMFPKEIAV